MTLASRLLPRLKFIKWFALGLALLFLIWILANSVDDPEYKLPSELELILSSLPANENTFFALYAIDEPRAQDAIAQGQVNWKAFVELERSRHAQTPAADTNKSSTTLPDSKAFACTDNMNCYQAWSLDKARLQASLTAHRDFANHCVAIAKLAKHEEQIAVARADANLGSHHLTYSRCMGTILAGAFIAFESGDKQTAIAQLTTAHAWAIQVLKGSRTLIYLMVAVRQLRSIYAMMGELTARDKTYAAEFVKIVSERIDVNRVATLFVPYEAVFLSRIIADTPDAVCGMRNPIDGQNICIHIVGYLKNATTRKTVDQLRTLVVRLGKLDAKSLIILSKEPLERSWFSMFKFRNTIGHILFNLSPPSSAYYKYAARVVDTELHREVLVVTMQAIRNSVNATEVIAQLNRHVWDDLAFGRVTANEATHQLEAKTWQAEFTAAMPVRDKIQVALPTQ
jgi:hypothetical protein